MQLLGIVYHKQLLLGCQIHYAKDIIIECRKFANEV